MTKPRAATTTVGFVDEYGTLYQPVFPGVRSFEQFTFLQVGMLSDLKRKTLPAIARAVEEADPQALHHFLANAPWSVAALRSRRLDVLRQALRGASFTLCIDETGDNEERQDHRLCGPHFTQAVTKGRVNSAIYAAEAFGTDGSTLFLFCISSYATSSGLGWPALCLLLEAHLPRSQRITEFTLPLVTACVKWGLYMSQAGRSFVIEHRKGDSLRSSCEWRGEQNAWRASGRNV